MNNHETKGEILYKKVQYKKVLCLGGFVKTTTSATLITLGLSLILNGIVKHPFLIHNRENSIIIGIISVIVAILIVYSIDKYREKYKKKELDIIFKEIDNKAEQIARKKVEKALQKIEEK